jgi:hypothetical protein
MSYHHTYTQKPRYNSVERHEQHNAEKIGLSLLLTFGLALIAILCNFFFEFLDSYLLNSISWYSNGFESGTILSTEKSF